MWSLITTKLFIKTNQYKIHTLFAKQVSYEDSGMDWISLRDISLKGTEYI